MRKEEIEKIYQETINIHKQKTLPIRITKWASMGIVFLNALNVLAHEQRFNLWDTGLGVAYISCIATGLALWVVTDGLITIHEQQLNHDLGLISLIDGSSIDEFMEKIEGFNNDLEN